MLISPVSKPWLSEASISGPRWPSPKRGPASSRSAVRVPVHAAVRAGATPLWVTVPLTWIIDLMSSFRSVTSAFSSTGVNANASCVSGRLVW